TVTYKPARHNMRDKPMTTAYAFSFRKPFRSHSGNEMPAPTSTTPSAYSQNSARSAGTASTIASRMAEPIDHKNTMAANVAPMMAEASLSSSDTAMRRTALTANP